MPKLILIVLLVVYGIGIYRFWVGFERTNFQRNLPYRIGLSLLWPALFAINKSFRRNFRKALKG
ncbi:hypothetical protein [Calothrix sp. NIES-3974]|uniref:hypothetical protein n=1 Tax=Calothrix sp. NIES-3974 TaxID=2005462 RepID=UPI000B5E3E86|nr:hypothetical protein [Calothrix sp. NIES-3974]BAZ07589.1 hypothetical protein NIES3974_42530 [Calothrix sp. NIES-3974]